MKKIGILTFHKSHNYGSALQSFALVKKLQSLGYDVEIIDYTQYNFHFQYGLIKAPVSINALKENLIHFRFWKSFKNRGPAFEKFANLNLPLSTKKSKHGNFDYNLKGKYDAVVCGSDQIWNPNAKDFDINYFLPNINGVRKISYAVSLNGGDLKLKSNYKDIRNYLLDYHSISVREESGRKNLDSFLMGEKQITVCLDPTLLQDKSIYEKIASPRLIQKPFIFLYSINFSADVINAAEILSERTKLPVYTFVAGRGNRGLIKSGSKFNVISKNVSPSDFISMVRDCEYVVTNSFHGTAFSVIYEKVFFAINKMSDEGTIQYDERIYDSLKLFGLLERFYTSKQIKTTNLNEAIDYKNVAKIRKSEIEKSVEYLKSSIQ